MLTPLATGALAMGGRQREAAQASTSSTLAISASRTTSPGDVSLKLWRAFDPSSASETPKPACASDSRVRVRGSRFIISHEGWQSPLKRFRIGHLRLLGTASSAIPPQR